MSWSEVENDTTEMEENPYPEEDSDLPHWQHQDEGQVRYRGEEDDPEADLAVAQELVDNTDSQSSPAGEAVANVVENIDIGVNSAASGCDGGIGLRNGTLPIQTTQFTDQNEAGREYYPSVMLDNQDSYEQDDAIAAPECENCVRHDACSESDRQLFLFEEAVPNHNGHNDIVLSGNDICGLQISEDIDSEHNPQDQATASKLKETTSDSDIIHSELNVESLHTFSGDVEISNNFDDAPEAEVGDLTEDRELYEEEDNLRLFPVQEWLQSSQNSVSSPDLSEQPLEKRSDLNVRNVAVTSGNNSTELVMYEGADNQLQAPECDREAVSYFQTSSQHQLVQFENASEFANSVQEQFENDTSDQQAGHDKIDSVHDDSFPKDGIAQLVNNGSRCDLNVPFNQDGSNHVILSNVVSELNQANSSPLPGQPADANTSISTQHLDNSVDPDKVVKKIDNSDFNSSNLPPPDKILNATDPHSSSFNLNGQLRFSDSSSQDSTTGNSQHSSPDKPQFQTATTKSKRLEQELDLVLQSDDEDELLHELDAELLAHASRTKSPQRSYRDYSSGLAGDKNVGQAVNGLQSMFDYGHIQEHNRQLLEQLKIRDKEIEKLTHERDSVKETLAHINSQAEEQQKLHNQSLDDLYSPQIKKLENTVSQQQSEIKALKEKLVSHDSAAKRAVSTLQNELKSRVDQITKMYEECLKEKDMMVIKFAESETKYMESKRMTEKIDTKLKEVLKDKDSIMSALKAAKADKLKAVSNFEMKSAEASNLQKELDQLKEAINSNEYRIKWFQNKLKDELESHKETKSSLEKTTNKLKEAREENEIIRKECQAIVKRYQESEEIKSNSLDKELKLKESELRTQMQERNDTEEIHQMTKRELESLKSQHKDTVEKFKLYQDKVQCLEEERKQNHSMIENYQEIMQRQKADTVELKARVASLSNLEDDYKRAQEMIQTLDKDIAELKIVNRDLQKDMESCRERESRMLILQSELSGTNAVLRSENTNLSNKASMLTGEVEKLKMEIQELETTVKDLSDNYDDEKTKRKEEAEKFNMNLAEKIKECNEIKQKWEDEIDSNKTLKRRHTNNVKDLTRQLQQVRKRLDAMEGKGDASSMGSRTNSNGSLNSIDNSSQHSTTVHQPPLQEFPVITEQVEVDKQVLIERIVRLQKSHARKNEKLEFLGEHIQQLLDEIRKKNKIIQCYALREESGTLSSEDMDANKTLLARKGGIMASVYTVHQQDGSMTLELSLQINQKLQAVLEDTLLKNITLKENLDTLGAEIARLSQENRRLQLSLQEVEKHLT